jgi:hypothetical protein
VWKPTWQISKELAKPRTKKDWNGNGLSFAYFGNEMREIIIIKHKHHSELQIRRAI